MSNLHPVLVHFPIVLLTCSLLFDLIGHLLNKSQFERSAWWTQLLGTAGLVATVTTGLLAENSVVIVEAAREHFETHEQIAFVIAGIYAVLFLWRIGSRTKLPLRREWIYLTLSVLAVTLIWVGAWYGGELVYTFGVGVNQH